MDQLASVVCRQFKLRPSSRVRIEVAEDTITLHPDEPRAVEDVPLAGIETRGNRRVIVGHPPLSDEDIVRAIQAGRDEREERIVAYRNNP